MLFRSLVMVIKYIPSARHQLLGSGAPQWGLAEQGCRTGARGEAGWQRLLSWLQTVGQMSSKSHSPGGVVRSNAVGPGWGEPWLGSACLGSPCWLWGPGSCCSGSIKTRSSKASTHPAHPSIPISAFRLPWCYPPGLPVVHPSPTHFRHSKP